MPPTRIIVMSVLLCTILVACRGAGEVAPIDLRAVEPVAADARGGKPHDPLVVLVRGFTDQRDEPDRLGIRTHLGGGATLFDVQGGPMPNVLTEVVVDYMKQQGWSVVVCPPGVPCEIDPKPDLVITGRILEFSAHAKSRPFSTLLTTRIKITLEAGEGAQGSVLKKHLVGRGEHAVFWFERADLEALVNETLRKALEQPLAELPTSPLVAQRRATPAK